MTTFLIRARSGEDKDGGGGGRDEVPHQEKENGRGKEGFSPRASGGSLAFLTPEFQIFAL
jgi:hypothetical protein